LEEVEQLSEGAPFNAERIHSLTRLGTSEKARGGGRRRTIGYKGVGFTAVFEISDTPQVITRGLAFGFDLAWAEMGALSREFWHVWARFTTR
jgi:hypothetical protein